MLQSTQVLIVGAGPTGLALAARLAKDGIDHMVIDQQAEGANTSRAAVIHARTLEVLEEIGAADEMVRRGLVLHRFSIREGAHELLGVTFDHLPTRYPFVLMLPQNDTEAVLLERLRALGGEVRRPLELTGMEINAEGVRAQVRDGRRDTSIEAAWVVAADGMHSAVREAAGMSFAGGQYQESFVLADVRLDGAFDPSMVQGYFSEDGLLLLAPLPHDHARLIAILGDAPSHPDLALAQALLDRRGPGGIRATELIWSSRFHVHHRIADSFRHGRVLLAGDAAHVHSPAGGQGMNIGIRDAIELGGALAAVVKNGAGPDVLDAWASRRRHVAEGVVRQTDLLTRGGTARGEFARIAREVALAGVDHLPPIKRAISRSISGLDERP